MTTALTLINDNRPTLELLALAYMPKDATQADAQKKIIREIANVEQWLMLKPDLKGCTPASFVIAIKQAISDGLSLAPGDDLVYLIPQRIKTGQNGSDDIYEWVASYDRTVNGEISKARQSGAILDHKRPQCEIDQGNGQVASVTVEFLVPSHPKPRWEKITFGPGHFMKWRRASHAKNARGKQDAVAEIMNYANINYTNFHGGIDPEFAGTKALIHGLNKRGMNMGEPLQYGHSEMPQGGIQDIPHDEIKEPEQVNTQTNKAPDLI